MQEQEEFEVCEYCGKRFSVTKGEIAYQEDPIASEIHDDDSEHWLCEQCVCDSMMDI